MKPVTPRHQNNEMGITLVEVIVVVLIVTLFASILIADFPRLERSFYLTRAAYQLSQDLKRAQDLSLSGAFIKDNNNQTIPISGYGVYIDREANNTGYLIYADSCQPADYRYTAPSQACPDGDYIVDTVNLTNVGKEVFIQGFDNITTDSTSIDFTPPNPQTTIQDICLGCNEMGVILSLTSDQTQTKEVFVNKAGLINVP